MPLLGVSAPDSNGDSGSVTVGASEVDVIDWIKVNHKVMMDKIFEVRNVDPGTGAYPVILRVYRSSRGTKVEPAGNTALDTNKIQVGGDTVLAASEPVALVVTNFCEWLKLSAIRQAGTDGTVRARLVSAYAGQEGPQ